MPEKRTIALSTKLVLLCDLEPGMVCVDPYDATLDIIVAIEYHKILPNDEMYSGGWVTFLAQEGFVYTDYMCSDNVKRVLMNAG